MGMRGYVLLPQVLPDGPHSFQPYSRKQASVNIDKY